MPFETSAKTKPGARIAPENLPADAPGRRRLPALLRRCWFNLNQTFRRRIAQIGITPDQFTVMHYLAYSALTDSDIAAVFTYLQTRTPVVQNVVPHPGSPSKTN